MAEQELRNSLKAGHELHWYRIKSVLGQGGFGITYLAHDPNLDQLVAIKEYLPMDLAVRDGDNSVYPASSANGERYQWGLDRFISEARTLAKFKHAAIVRVLSVFEENNTAYMVMEYEHGESLQFILDGRKTLTEDELIPILAPLLDGLELIHGTGFIHRDIKPANIYIRDDKSPVLLDFGSARQALGEQTKSLTSIVSPGYAPFEQYYSKSDRQGPWTDIYSLAATMYRSISGVMPMDAIDRSEAILKAERDVFVSAREIGEGRYSVNFMRALDHALSFNEKKRPQTVAEWRAELGIEARNSLLISQPLPPAGPSKTVFEPQPIAASEIETRVADSAFPGVQNIDAVTAPGTAIPNADPFPQTVVPGAKSTLQKKILIGVALCIGLFVAVAFWIQSSPSQDPQSLRGRLASITSDFSGNSLERLVSRGDRALSAGRLFDPLFGSAIDYYRRAIKIDPTHEAALQGIALISAQMLPAVESAIEDGDLERAGKLLEILRSLPAHRELLANLEQEYALARASLAADAVQTDRIQEFLNEAATDVAEGRLLSPSGNNALLRYRTVQLLDPENTAAKNGITAIVASLTENFAAALTAGKTPVARKRLADLKPIHSDREQYKSLVAQLDNAQKRNAELAKQETQVAELIRLAAADLKANRLSTPASGNALDRYNQVLAIDQKNSDAAAGLKNIGDRYVVLARSAIRNQQFSGAKDYIARARVLEVAKATIAQLSAQIATAQASKDNIARSLTQERERLALQAKQQLDKDRLRQELDAAKNAAAQEKRRRQEAEAKRLFEIGQAKQKTVVANKRSASDRAQRSTLVIEFDGVGGQTELYGLMQDEVRADMENRLRALGYNIVLHHEANRSSLTRLFIVRFRANLNSASGVFSYSASLALYPNVPVTANSIAKSGMNPVWTKGVSGVAVQMQLRRVRDQYQQIMRLFSQQVGQAPGRL
jgi:serine/threonine protein kinase